MMVYPILKCVCDKQHDVFVSSPNGVGLQQQVVCECGAVWGLTGTMSNDPHTMVNYALQSAPPLVEPESGT